MVKNAILPVAPIFIDASPTIKLMVNMISVNRNIVNSLLVCKSIYIFAKTDTDLHY